MERSHNRFTHITIHCSASDWGCADVIRQWHEARGWDTIGYHFVILNGFPHSSKHYIPLLNGVIEPGRDLKFYGAHVRGHNRGNIGICLIGNEIFTYKQLNAMRDLVNYLMYKYGIPLNNVRGHCEYTSRKTCPNMPMPIVRLFIKDGQYRELEKQLTEGG